MIINSINSIMANNYKRNARCDKPQFRGTMGNFNNPIEQPAPQSPKFVSDLKRFSFLKSLFK
ncbi:MAG: hypothetical protein WCF95_02445 [bacterium]